MLWATSLESVIVCGVFRGQFSLAEEGKKGVVGNSDVWNSSKRQVLAAGSKVGYHHRSLTGKFGGGSFG
jgi:hypothetical protein